MKHICKHQYPSDLCGICNPPAKEKAKRPSDCSAFPVGFPDRYQMETLWHADHRCAGGLYCGGGPDVDALVEAGLMEYAGRKSFVPDPYYRITALGREVLRKRQWRQNA